MSLKNYEFWFVVGSQFLYGPEVLETVAARAQEMVDELNASGTLPCKVVYKVTAKTNKEITDVVEKQTMTKSVQVSLLGVIHSAHQKCGLMAL